MKIALYILRLYKFKALHTLEKHQRISKQLDPLPEIKNPPHRWALKMEHETRESRILIRRTQDPTPRTSKVRPGTSDSYDK